METINKTEVEYRFRRSVESYEENARVQKLIVDHLIQLISDFISPDTISRYLEVGCGTGFLTQRLQHMLGNKELYINDLVREMCEKTAVRCDLSSVNCLKGDIEMLQLPEQFQLIVSASTFQWLEQPKETFLKFYTHLSQEGWLIFSSFGEDNFKELKAVTGRGLQYRTLNEMKEILSGHFNILYAEENRHVLTFSDPLEILQHMKKTGVNATRSSQNWTRKNLREFVERYTALFYMDESYPLTYHPFYLVARKK